MFVLDDARGLGVASALIERVTASSPRHADAWLMKGSLHRVMGDQPSASWVSKTLTMRRLLNMAANLAGLHLLGNVG